MAKQTSESQVLDKLLTRFCPDTEPANMSTRCQFQQIELLHTDGVHTRNVAESTSETLVLVIDDKGTPALDAATVTHLSFARAEPLALVNLWETNLIRTWFLYSSSIYYIMDQLS